MGLFKNKKNSESETKTNEATYYARELVENCDSIFEKNISSECVEAALKVSGQEKATISNAKQIVNEFLKKEVI